MPRTFVLCFSIVAALSIRSAAASPSTEDAFAPPSIVAVARSVGLDAARDRARLMSEVVRLVYSRSPSEGQTLPVADVDAARDVRLLVPVPLSAAVWSRLLKRNLAPDDLVPAILQNRAAALVSFALAALDDETLDFLAAHVNILERIHERSPAVFAAFGSSLRIHGGRVVPPGGDRAVRLWEAVVHQRVDSPDLFLRALYEENEARVAYLFNTVAELDDARAAFALGLWIPDDQQRLARFTELATVAVRQYREWRPADTPFIKPLNDLSTALARVRVDPSGAPLAPSDRRFWSKALDAAGSAETASIDAAWLAQVTAPGDMFARADRLGQFAFGQRVFANAREADWPDAIDAIRSYPRQRMLMLTIERIGMVADLNLRVAVLLAELHLPAGLARPVLAAAVQDFIDAASPTDFDDWLGMARGAGALSRQHFEDYVAAAASVGGPLIPEETLDR